MEIVEISQLVGGVLIGIGGAYKFFYSDRKRHIEITKHQKHRNKLALDQTIKLDNLQDAIEMSNGFKTEDKIAEIKHVSYGEQKLYFIREAISLYNRNNIADRERVIDNIKTIISKTISNTDRFLSKTIPERYIYSTNCKILYVNNNGVPEKIYDIYLDVKSGGNPDLFGRLGSAYDFALGQIKSQFYHDDGRAK